jgi:23S rRNA (cytosine1962-C5)-methyltransferase
VPLLHLFPSFPADRIVYEDDDVIVIDKPVDVSTHAPDAGRSDDAFSRLKLALSERSGVSPDDVYLGIHQRLDRDTSGVLLFTRRKSANAGISAEFEGRKVKKTYLAVVANWPKRLDQGVLRDELVPAEGGKMQVVKGANAASHANAGRASVDARRDNPISRGARYDKGIARSRVQSQNSGRPNSARGNDARQNSARGNVNIAPEKSGTRRGDAAARFRHGDRSRPSPSRNAISAPRHEKGQLAVTRFRVLRREGSRALLELQPETGRTHQLRVQLAAAGGPIAGDTLYEGAPAVRLMLHASRLELRHPNGGARLDVRAPTPPELEQWLTEPKPVVAIDGPFFTSRVRAAIDARWALGRSTDTTAFRLLNRDGDGVEGLAVDVYGEHLIAHFFSSEALAHKEAILGALEALDPRGIYLKVHPKQSNNLVDPRTPDLAPSEPVRGVAAPDPLVIHELGLAFRVRLGDGLKTGIFLDQRENRRRVRELSKGKRVLNLFAYTCAFTVAAAAGGARETLSVDSTKGVLEWGKDNLEQNGLLRPAHVMIADDAIVWLKHAAKKGERFDLVVLDPPSFATTKTSRFAAADDFADLAARALGVLAPGGSLLACTNHRGISMRKFRKQLHEAGRVAAVTIAQLKDLPWPTDFPGAMDGEAHLKSVLVTVR